MCPERTEHVSSTCSKKDVRLLITISGHPWSFGKKKHFSWQLRCETPARPVSTPRRSSAPSSVNSSSPSGTISVVLVRNSSPGATEQNQKSFHSSGGTMHTCHVKQRMNHIMRETLRGGYMPPKHLPCFTGSHLRAFMSATSAWQ